IVTLQIHAKLANGMPAVADLSLSVFDDRQVLSDENRETISTYLLLSSELKGLIESPAYYFNPLNKDRAEALDHLLLTQGWRRFTFKKALDQQWPPPEYRIEKGLTIKGKMLDANTNKPVSDGTVTYLSIDPVPFTSAVRTNSAGDFELNDIIYFDSAKAVLQGETKKGYRLVKFMLNKEAEFPPVRFPRLPFTEAPTEFDSTFIVGSTERRNIDRAYNFDEKTIRLNEVVIRGQREDPPNTVSKTHGKGSATVQVAGIPSMENQSHPLQLLQSGVAGVQVTRGGQNWSISVRGGGTPFIMIDEIPVSIENLNALSVNDIERVEVWKGGDAAIFGSRGGNGVIGFYTKKGVGSITDQAISTIDAMGYQVEREFYGPNYETEKPEHIKPDKRTTLFWAPLIKTDSTGRASVSFYNNDVETTVTGIAEGISVTGKPGSTTFKFVIRKN
ncbi:MAG TPA: TonB-dependent receptor plug domain-containing protein, partial [Chryseolinea sp.]